MARTDYSSIDDYLRAQPESAVAVLQRVRAILRKALPGADEVISYQIPAFKQDGRPVVYFAGWKEHYSLYPATAEVVRTLRNELGPYEVSKGTIRFPIAERIPAKLIERIAKLRAKEEKQRAKAKTAGKTAAKKKVAVSGKKVASQRTAVKR